MTTVALIRRLRDEFTAMPGLRLTEAQVRRLCDVSVATSASALRALVSARFLRPLEDGSYRRADLAPNFGTQPSSGAVEAPWRRILCLIEFEDGSRDSLTLASHSALSYATSLGVTHRARVTALHLMARLPEATPARLVVLGRQHGGAACLSQLREVLRDAPCHVLIVHPSGQAAVA